MASFLQSREWAEIQAADGLEGNEMNGIRYFRHMVPGGFFYFYAPRPLIRDLVPFRKLLDELRRTGALFFRLEPEESIDWGRLKFITRETCSVQPHENAVLHLESEETMLARMHPKARYNLRLAERHGIRVAPMVGDDALRIFHQLILRTATRDRFRAHPLSHYRHLVEHNSHTFSNELFVAWFKEAPVAIAMANFYEGTATYLHGGSDENFRKYMAPYLLHWMIAREAMRRGCEAYDLGGVDEVRWPGLTRFKMGLGASMRRYPATRDIIFRPLVSAAYRAFRSARRFI